MVLIFAVLLGVNAYIFVFRGNSLWKLMNGTATGSAAPPAASIAKAVAPATPLQPKKDAPEESEEVRVVERVLGANDILERVWKADGVAPRDVHGVAAALEKVFDLRTVRPGHAYALRFDAEDHLQSVDLRVTPALAYHVEQQGGTWVARTEEKPIETRTVEIGGQIVGSLYDAVKRSGESTALVAWFVDLFAWDINFYTDSHAGDRFKMIVEKRYLGGKFYKYGRVIAAEYQGRVGTYRTFWFESQDKRVAGYYTEHGESVVRSLLKTPLRYVRVSSKFDRRRFHPILHREKAHLGIDYAAPAGTPVWATAGGRVVDAGPRGGAGNTVILAHPNGLTSIYMHLSKFARGLRAGQAVRQKQVIGYVGATGLATGPHLHFGLKRNGAYVDPFKLHADREQPLDARYKAEFADAITPRLTALAAIDVKPATAGLAPGLLPMP
jgi:murein DD-endopeptidase MepM/ murein hydrolase activator NlpD